jgi:hypothetical protein
LSRHAPLSRRESVKVVVVVARAAVNVVVVRVIGFCWMRECEVFV